MARAPFTIEVKDVAGNAVFGASVNITQRVGGAAATLYSGETGPTTVSNPLVTDTQGRVSSWVERGAYTATVSGSGITTYAVPFDAAPGANRTIDATWLPAQLVPEVTSLPTTGLIEGQEVDQLVDNAGTYGGPYLWRCKYRSGTTGTSKWHAVGGPAPLFISDLTARTHPGGSAVWADLTVAMGIVIPVAGVYQLSWGHNVNTASGVDTYAGIRVYTTPGSGGTDPVVGTNPTADGYAASSQSLTGPSRTWRFTLAANNEARVRYRTGGAGGTPSFNSRHLSVTPIRLG
jgi:hypothetical protein